ncbi:cell division protein FtsQ [Marisediminicola sp. LYQ134]|uniref:cell division protein FtsQ n=1 Tax=unclassified Marisediminicola TaxID=2618316 RepID=UPI003982F1E4
MTRTTPATSTPARRGIPRPGELSQAQKLMVFVLSMTMFGLANILTEVLPELRLGPVELSVSYLAFVPVVIVCLFHPLYGALGAPLGEIVFVDLLMGNFSGIGELEGYIQLALGLYIGGSLVRDPRKRWQVAMAAMVTVLLDKLVGGIVDVGKVWVGVADAEYVEGLPQSILLLEGIAFSTDFIISGIIFGAIPAMLLAPRLYGKIEPLLGMAPRDPAVPVARRARASAPFVIGALFLSFVAMIMAFLDELDVTFGVWEPDFIGQYGAQFLWIGVSAAIIVLVTAVVIVRWMIARRSADRAAVEPRSPDRTS